MPLGQITQRDQIRPDPAQVDAPGKGDSEVAAGPGRATLEIKQMPGHADQRQAHKPGGRMIEARRVSQSRLRKNST